MEREHTMQIDFGNYHYKVILFDPLDEREVEFHVVKAMRGFHNELDKSHARIREIMEIVYYAKTQLPMEYAQILDKI